MQKRALVLAAAVSAVCLTVAAVAGFALAADTPLKVSNRLPEPGEWGYHPADGATARMNPPSLTWIHEKAAVAYTVQIVRGEDFSASSAPGSITAGPLPFEVYTHNATLPAGKYAWRYRFADKKGKLSDWSVVRHFSIDANAIAFPMPNRADQQARVPKDHPRLFMRPEDVDSLRKAVASGLAGQRFAKVRAEADKLLKAEPTPEPKVMGTNRDANVRDFWWPNRVTALKAGDECETLAFTYLITKDPKYGAAARKFILAYAAWDPNGPTNFSLNDEAAFPVLYKLPRAYDWAYSALTQDDRAKVRQAMIHRGADVWKSGEVRFGWGHLNSPYESHANRAWHKLGECALALYGDANEATDWLDYAVNKFYAAYPVWADDDGGWHEGASYSEGYMSKIVWWLEVSKAALKIDGLKKPYFSQVGDFLMYMAPPGSPNSGMGDLSYNRQGTGPGGYLEFFCRQLNAPGQHAAYWQWWKEKWRMGDQGGILGVLYAATLGDPPAAKAPTDIPASKVFHGIGQASLHLTILDANQDVHFHFKSSPMGSQSHGHNPQNSFQLTAYGETLLPACTYRDWHGSKFHYQWVHSTFAQNAVLVDGNGQTPHTKSPAGQIVEDRLSPAMDYVVGDATPAYDGRLERFRRHVAFVKPDLIVLYDDLVAKEPATFQFMLHGLSPFKIDQAGNSLLEERPKASVTVKYLSPLALTYTQTDGFDPKPAKAFPNLWHVQAGTQEKRKELGVITVLVPARAGGDQPFTAKRLESESAIGVQIERGGKTTTVAFRKAGTSGKATLGTDSFDAPVYLKN